jgi:hypothetical protein
MSNPPPAAPTPPPWRTKVAAWLAKTWWAGVGGICAAVGIGLAVFAACDAHESTPPPPAPQINEINGNCNGQGSGITVNC